MEQEVSEVEERIGTTHLAEIDHACVAAGGLEDGGRIEIAVNERADVECSRELLSDARFECVDFRSEKQLTDRTGPWIWEVGRDELFVGAWK